MSQMSQVTSAKTLSPMSQMSQVVNQKLHNEKSRKSCPYPLLFCDKDCGELHIPTTETNAQCRRNRFSSLRPLYLTSSIGRNSLLGAYSCHSHYSYYTHYSEPSRLTFLSHTPGTHYSSSSHYSESPQLKLRCHTHYTHYSYSCESPRLKLPSHTYYTCSSHYRGTFRKSFFPNSPHKDREAKCIRP